MTGIRAAPVIEDRADRDPVPVTGQRNRTTREVTGAFSIDVLAGLDPRVPSELEDPDVTGTGAIVVIEDRADRNGVPVVR